MGRANKALAAARHRHRHRLPAEAGRELSPPRPSRSATRSGRPCSPRHNAPYRRTAGGEHVPPAGLRRQPGRALHLRHRTRSRSPALPEDLRTAPLASPSKPAPEDTSARVKARYAELGVAAELAPFFGDTAAADGGRPSGRLPRRRLDRAPSWSVIGRPVDPGAAAACAGPRTSGQRAASGRRRRGGAWWRQPTITPDARRRSSPRCRRAASSLQPWPQAAPAASRRPTPRGGSPTWWSWCRRAHRVEQFRRGVRS